MIAIVLSVRFQVWVGKVLKFISQSHLSSFSLKTINKPSPLPQQAIFMPRGCFYVTNGGFSSIKIWRDDNNIKIKKVVANSETNQSQISNENSPHLVRFLKPQTPTHCESGFCILKNFLLRKVRDSNPRNSYPFTAFRVRPDRPLRQLSFPQKRCKGSQLSIPLPFCQQKSFPMYLPKSHH